MAVDEGSCSFTVGAFTCIAIGDGTLRYPLGNLFANKPKAQVEEALRGWGQPPDFVTLGCTCLYVEAGKHRVLIDTGAGRASPWTGRLAYGLAAAGVSPSQIDTVVISHAHPAHAGGLFAADGGLAYPNARFYLSQAEYDFWTAEVAYGRAPERLVDAARASLELVWERLTLVDCVDAETVPGVCVLPVPGHTPGHMAVAIASQGQRLLYLADTAYHPLHLEHPDWTSIYDMAPEQAVAVRRALIEQAADEATLLLGPHFAPFPGLGRITRTADGWLWQPAGPSRT
jgi:glyoxylase-like metal-dependent hydrolase (beta-lactamase superfamily II)